MRLYLILIFGFLLSACVVEKGDVKIDIKNRKSSHNTSQINSANVSSISIVNNQVIVNGNNLNVVEGLKINGASFNELFTIESKSSNQILANANRAFSFDISKIFELVLSDAYGSATFPISFDLPNGSVTDLKLNSMSAATGQVLKFDGTKWTPATLSNSQIYLGTYNATSNTPDLNATTPISGDYYIVTTAGTFNLVNYEVGDWIMHNGLAWEKISNSTNVVSAFNGRRGIVTPAVGDYSWSMLSNASGKITGSTLAGIADVDLTGIGNNKILKWDAGNSKWIVADDLSGGGAGTVSSTEISDGTITNVDIGAAAGITYSKLTIAAGEIPQDRIAGFSSAISAIIEDAINDAVTTNAPSENAVFDALATKLNLGGGTMTGALGVLAIPVGDYEAIPKKYVDDQITATTTSLSSSITTSASGKVSKTGDTMSGVLTLNNAATTGEIHFSELASSGAKYSGFKAPDTLAATLVYTLPSAAPTAGQVLSSNAAGVTSWLSIPSAPVSSVHGRTGAVVAVAGDYNAAHITNTPAGNIAATNVQSALNELDTEKQSIASLATDVRAITLSGLSIASSGIIAAGDSLLASLGNLQKQISDLALSAVGGDLSGNLPNPKVVKIQTIPVSATAPTSGNFFKYDGSNWLGSPITIGDIKSLSVGNLFPASACAANQTLSYALLVDAFTCVNIDSLDASKITTGTIADALLPASAKYWAAATGGINYAGGNVGIGTTTPGAKLEVSGNAYVTGQIRTFGNYPCTGYTDCDLVVGDATTNRHDSSISIVSATSAAKLKASGNTLSLVNWTDSDIWTFKTNSGIFTGNVGIGSTTPAIYTPASGPNRRFLTITGNTSTGTADGAGIVEFATAATDADGVVNGGMQWSDSNLLSTDKRYASILSLRSGVTANNRGSSIAFYTKADNASGMNNRMTIDNAGNVGIGTTNPTTALHVVGGSIYSQNDANSGSTIAALTAGAADANGGHAGIGVNSIANAVDYGYGMSRIDLTKSGWLLAGRNANAANEANDFFALKYTNVAGITSEYFRVLANGNVGIGTTAPAAKLEIAGSSGSTLKVVDGNQAAGKVLTSDANGQASWQHSGGLSNITGTVVGGGVGAAAVTDAGYQDYFGGPYSLSLPSAGTYFISSQVFYSWTTGCGDIYTHWSGSNIVNASMDGKWQACGNSGVSTWNTYTFVITVSAATTLTAKYQWTNSGTSGTALFSGAHFVRIGQ